MSYWKVYDVEEAIPKLFIARLNYYTMLLWREQVF